MYGADIMERFMNPKFAGIVRGANAVGFVQSEETNESIKLYLNVSESKIVQDARFKAFGCPVVIAVADALSQMVVGLTLDELEDFNEQRILYMFNKIPDERLYVIILAIDVLNVAIDDYYKRLRRGTKKRKRHTISNLDKYTAILENAKSFIDYND